MSATGQTATAEDCLYHQLSDDPWSAEGDRARAMLQDMDEAKAEDAPGRAEKLIRLAMLSWQRGERALGMRRMRRAVRLVKKKAQPLTALALMHMTQGDVKRAIRCLTRAVNAERTNPLPLCTLATLLCEQDRLRMSRGLLAKAAPLCGEPQMEERFCHVAWIMDAWPELEAFLAARLKRTPYRIALLHARAQMLHEQGRTDQAQETWRLILAVDPEDRTASTLLKWTQAHPDVLIQPGKLPPEEMQRQRRGLTTAEELFRPGSDGRRVLDWCAASDNEQETLAAFAAALRHPDREAEVCWLREVMMRHDMPETSRRLAVQRLSELGRADMAGVLISGRFMSVQRHGTQAQTSGELWRMFLPVLLRVAGRDVRLSEVVSFAAGVWVTMTGAEQQDAATHQSVSWSRVMYLLWLWQQGQAEEAERVVRKLKMPLRRFQRIMSMFALTMENESGDAGEGDT